MKSVTEWAELRTDIAACGYFPDLVEDSVALALGDEAIVAHLAHHEATFAGDAIQRHLTVLVLTPTRLLLSHTDETDERAGEVPGGAVSTVESVPLSCINAVALTRVVSNPAAFGKPASAVVETWLTLGWGMMRRIDLEPASCSDPNCDADHGYSGTLVAEDLTVRVSAAADGPERVVRLVSFATALQQATGRGIRS